MAITNEITNGAGRPPTWDHPRRCTAMKSDGSERCRHYALRGSNVCKYHGGAAPQVLRAAGERMMSDLYGPMLAGLRRLLDSGDLDAIAKACAILARQYGMDADKGRLPPEYQPGAPDGSWLEFLEIEELRSLLEESKAVTARYEALARERMEAGVVSWAANDLPVIDVTPSAVPVEPETAHLASLHTRPNGDQDATRSE